MTRPVPRGPNAVPPGGRAAVRTALGMAVLAVTVVTAAGLARVTWAHGHEQTGLPVSWCRWRPGRLALLPPLAGWRFITSWQLDGVALVALAPFAAGYGWAVRRVRRARPAGPWPRARSASFAGGLLVIVIATCSSIGVYDMTLFSVHMAQHLALIMVAPPLLAAGRPLTLAMHATRNPWHTRIKRAARSRVVAAVTWPPVAYAAYAVTIVATHLSGLMDAVMTRPWLGQAEHLLYVVVGYLFFVLVFGDEPIRWRLAMPARLLLVVLSMAVDTFVGLVLLQGSQPITMLPHPGWGSSALVDTQTGGAIMWFFGDGIMAILVMLLFRTWAARPQHTRRASRSWLEQSRQQALATHTGVPQGRTDLDEDDAALTAYNAWLTRLATPDRRAP